jgi:hypothetical protein
MQTKLFVVLISFLMSCSQAPVEQTPSPTRAASDDAFVKSLLHAEKPGCLAMTQQFCSALYAPENQGELDFGEPGARYSIRLGHTKNDFSHVDYEFLSSQIESRSQFPLDLKTSLTRREFFKKMKSHLGRNSLEGMSLEKRLQSLREEDEVGFIWTLSLKETLMRRMEERFPGYSGIRENLMPIELKFESMRQSQLLRSEVATTVWSNHANWKKVRAKFRRVQRAYLKWIRSSDEIPKNLKKSWMSRIRTVKLMVPGSDPEVNNEDCSKGETNAYYFTEKNELTVCAGDFNSEEIEQTLAHELGHALDLDRTRYLFEIQSELGKRLNDLQSMACSKQRFRCEDWAGFKRDLPKLLGEWSAYRNELPAFNACLKGRSLLSPIPNDYIERVAKEEVAQSVSELAQTNVFLRIISPDLPLIDGTSHKNPMYLNPCGYFLWKNQPKPLDEEMGLLLFFTAEYRCSRKANSSEKFKSAIELARSQQEVLVNAKIKMEGEFSERERLSLDGYSAAPTERFADAIGQRVFSKLLLADSKIATRRAQYFANNAWLCAGPSIRKLFPNETAIQRDYYSESHSGQLQRQKELLIKELRQTLECRADFEEAECSIDSK